MKIIHMSDDAFERLKQERQCLLDAQKLAMEHIQDPQLRQDLINLTGVGIIAIGTIIQAGEEKRLIE